MTDIDVYKAKTTVNTLYNKLAEAGFIAPDTAPGYPNTLTRLVRIQEALKIIDQALRESPV